jgi:lipopolysaccharide export system protein LptA
MMSIFKHGPQLDRIDHQRHSLTPSVLIVIAALLWATSSWAQTQEEEPPIEIISETGQLDVPTGAYLLKDNVRINRGTLSVFADEARSFTGDTGEIERVELYGAPTRWNDTLDDGTQVDGESDEILYDFTTNLITMRGNAEIRNVQGQFSGNQLVYDLDTQNLVGDGGVRLLIEPSTAESATQQIINEEPTDRPEAPSGLDENADPDDPPEETTSASDPSQGAG